MIKQNKELIVFSVGDNAISKNYTPNYESIERVCILISNLVNKDYNVILVSAGAILMGMKKFHLEKYPEDVSLKQALASSGQIELIKTYQKIFHRYSQDVAQILLTREIIKSHTRIKNAKDTLNKLLSINYIPIINENDTVSVEDIESKNNYPLASVVANFLNANSIVIKKGLNEKYDIIQAYSDKIIKFSSENELYKYFYQKKQISVNNDKLKAFPLTLELK